MREFTAKLEAQDWKGWERLVARVAKESTNPEPDPYNVARDVAMALTGLEIEFHQSAPIAVRVVKPLGKKP